MQRNYNKWICHGKNHPNINHLDISSFRQSSRNSHETMKMKVTKTYSLKCPWIMKFVAASSVKYGSRWGYWLFHILFGSNILSLIISNGVVIAWRKAGLPYLAILVLAWALTKWIHSPIRMTSTKFNFA